MIKNLAFYASIAVYGCVQLSCAAEKKANNPGIETGPRVSAVIETAHDKNIDERVLLTTTYVQSNFGYNIPRPENKLPDSNRGHIFGLSQARNSNLSPTDFDVNLKFFAEKLKTNAALRPPRDSFDWYWLAAQTIVGENVADPNLKDISIRLVLLGLIDTHNKGFAALLPNNENFVLPPADESQIIDLKKLDAGQGRYVSNFRFGKDFASDLFVAGRKEAETQKPIPEKPKPDALPTDKPPQPAEFPTIVINWCPASTLTCFEHLKSTVDSPTHFFSYKGRNGEREVIQFHDINKDLNWYGTTRTNTVSLTIAGPAGTTRDDLRPDWIDWEDYMSIKQTIQSIVMQISRDIPGLVSAPIGETSWLKTHVVEAAPGFHLAPTLPASKIGQPDFTLPLFWDSKLFRELLERNLMPRNFSQVRVETPSVGQVFEGTQAAFSIYPDPETTSLEIYQDSENAEFGKSWDLISKADISLADPRFDDTHNFRNPGANGTGARAIKIVCRKQDGTLLGTRVVRFAVKNSQQK